MAAIVESNAAGSFLQLKELARRTGERIALAIDSGALFHRRLHLFTKRGNTLPASALLKELVVQPCLLVQCLSQRMAAATARPSAIIINGPIVTEAATMHCVNPAGRSPEWYRIQSWNAAGSSVETTLTTP